MKRSEINAAIAKAKQRMDKFSVKLPFFGYWTVEDWKNNAHQCRRIYDRMLGWDVTDFGTDDFKTTGAVLFTVRNGDKDDSEMKAPYAEKYIVLDDATQQQIPYHYHILKTEDIINRAGGVLCVQMYHEAQTGGLDTEKKIDVYMDGIKCTFEPGEVIEIHPGDSVTIEPYVYHRFYAKKDCGLLIVGEVSKVNDDNCDNVFLVKSERFSAVEEDEEIIHPLVNEYEKVI